MDFYVIGSQKLLNKARPNSVYLHIDHWNDYSFFTLFRAVLSDNSARRHDLGMVKIGFKGQDVSIKTRETLEIESN
ncbi:hypothetical protein soil367_05070 [Hydrocarboniclastica marina]|uniref:Uncharacterized protein n=1 Tax=Hydrocarboniclastica marina TaxID=2259620 RepID=A0A4P7XGN9_9ALTE|nr:hypothetical protein soil367_05070 [Hydrocarboniclastica marina]